MFKPSRTPRVFALPPGVDFPRALLSGLDVRLGPAPPEVLARVHLVVNTRRMARRIRDLYDAGPARLLPHLSLVTDLGENWDMASLPPPVPPLRRRLELAQLIGRLLDRQPDLAARASLYDLADSLAALMEEMQGEGVSPDAIRNLDVQDMSGHWARAQAFFRIADQFLGSDSGELDAQTRQRQVVENLISRWQTAPPEHPVILAGSTGSRGTTLMLMQAIARLPQGAIVLPGYDFDQPAAVWSSLDDAILSEDHPQFRFKRLMDSIGFGHRDVRPWTDARPVHPRRNALISLSLRPAPVTNQWLTDGPDLGDLFDATDGLTLVEANSPRAEAETIALRLRQAAEDGITAALISPDRMLTRQVTAALDRWDIKPDDSAGTPLALSPPGRFLRHVADLFGQALNGEALLTLLKHPLCHSEHPDRGDHLRHTRDLELHLRRWGPPLPKAEDLFAWAAKADDRGAWAAWLASLATGLKDAGIQPLGQYLEQHIDLAQALCAGPNAEGAGGLWAETAGREADRICKELRQAAPAGGLMSARDYAALFGGVINEGVVRDRDAGHPNILIWGTLEARVQGVDLTILGGMNDGVWPEAPAPDPWLNRVMRAKAGLLLPERRIGLSAHDYQQAIAGKEVWITRAKRSADAETVPSRWVNRLTNLLNGLPDQNGQEALKAMLARGTLWTERAAKLSAPTHRTDPEPRPSPCPPPHARPDQLSVTQIKTLIRDPFAIYARKVLHLSQLDPLAPSADAPLRGIIVHKILERFITDGHGPADREALMRIAHEEFTTQCPWPTVRAQWIARMDRVADKFLADEGERQARAEERKTESWGEIAVAATGIKLTCKADRIDLTNDGDALIYDYKTGVVPTGPQQEKFDKQLLLEAAMVERGAFKEIGRKTVAGASFIGVNAAMRNVDAPLKKQPPDQVWAELETLFTRWQDQDRGYTARLALFLKTDQSPYDHLSRYGEWDTNEGPKPVVLK